MMLFNFNKTYVTQIKTKSEEDSESQSIQAWESGERERGVSADGGVAEGAVFDSLLSRRS